MGYNYQIVIQQKSVTADAYGERDATWTTYKTVWAELDDGGGSLTYESDMPVYAGTKTFVIRTADASGLTTKMRISYNSETYRILSLSIDERQRTTITAEAYDDE